MMAFKQFNHFQKFQKFFIHFTMHYVFSNKFKITNSQNSEFRKNCFLHNVGRLSMCYKSKNKYLKNYLGFVSEEDTVFFFFF